MIQTGTFCENMTVKRADFNHFLNYNGYTSRNTSRNNLMVPFTDGGDIPKMTGTEYLP